MGSLPCALLAFLAAQESQPQQRTIEQQLEALIEKTNALESFHARYRVTLEEPDEEPEEGTLELAYSAPDRGAVRIHAGEMEFEAFWLEDRVYALAPDSNGQATWTTARMQTEGEPSAALALLNELFPPGKAHEYALETGVTFGLRWPGIDGCESFNLDVRYMPSGRHCLLDWLPRMKRHAAEMRTEGDDVLWSGEDSLCRLSTETGFPVRIKFTDKEKGQIDVALEELLLDETLESDPFELSEEARQAPDDPSLTASLDLNGPTMTRALILWRVHWLLERGDRSWDDDTRSDLEAVLKELHREALAQRFEPWIERVRSRADELAQHIREELEKDPPPERSSLEELVTQERASLANVLDETIDRYVESLPDTAGPMDEHPVRAELFDAEQDAAELAFEEFVRDPLLAYFDETTAAALGD